MIFTDALCPNPTISVTTPSSQTKCVGQTVTFTVSATASGTLSYQWKDNNTVLVNGLTANGSTISGATTNSLTIANIQSGDASTKINCEVTNTCGGGNTPRTKPSDNSTLIVTPLATASITFGANSICSGSATSVQFSGSPNTTVHYKVNNGATQTIVTAANGQANTNTGNLTANATYTIVDASNTCGTTVLGTDFTVTVNNPPTVTNPSSTSVNAPNLANFSVSATGANLSFQWQENSVNVSGPNYTVVNTLTGSTLTINNTTGLDGKQYRCIVSNGCNPAATSTAATLTVISCTAPTLGETHTNVTCNGADNGSIDLTTTGGTGPFNYSWSNGATDEDVSGLAPNTYSVTVTTQTGGCSATLSNIVITEPDAISISNVSQSTIACHGGTATVTITAAGGTGALSYTF